MGCTVETHLNSNVLQRCVNMNQCGWDFILITQSTVELPSRSQRDDEKSVPAHLCDVPVGEKREETRCFDFSRRDAEP